MGIVVGHANVIPIRQTTIRYVAVPGVISMSGANYMGIIRDEV